VGGAMRRYETEDLESMTEIWNGIVDEANAFPQTERLTKMQAEAFFASQSYTGAYADGDEVLGLYILHPNNVGRCGHIANASFAVKKTARGRGTGEKLVLDCIKKGKELGFRILQFNAVVCTNTAAIRLYERLGFTRLGRIPKGFRLNDGTYLDIFPYYIALD